MGGRDYCCVINCRSRRSECKQAGKKLVFSHFPMGKSLKAQERRKLWLQAIRREHFVPTVYSQVCGRHFVSGFQINDPTSVDYVPTLHLGCEKSARTKASSMSKKPAGSTTSDVASCLGGKRRRKISVLPATDVGAEITLGEEPRPSEDVCSPDPESFPTEVIPNKIKKLKPQSKKAAAPPVGRPCTICEKHEKNPAKDPRTVTLSIPPNIEALFRYAATDMRLSGAGKKKQASGSCAHRKRRSKSTVTRKNKSKRKQLSSASQNQKNKILVPTLQLPFSPGHTPSMSSNMWQNKERTERTTNKTSYVIRRKSPDFILEADGDASLLRTICQDGAVEDVISTARKSEPLLTMTEDQGVVVVKIKRKSYAESDADPLASNFSQGWQPDGMEFMSADTNITNRITPEGRNMEQIFVSKSCLKAVEGVEYTFGVASHKAELAQSKMPQDVAKLEVDSSQEVKPLIKREETVHLKKEREVKSEPIHSVDYKDCLQRDVSSCKSDMISQIVNETEKTFAVKTETRAPVEKSASYTHSLSEPDWSSVSDVEDQEDIIAVKEEPEDWSAHWFGQDSTLMDGELMKRAPGKDVYPTGLFKNIHEVHQLKGDALKTQVLEVGPCGEMFSDGPFELSSNKSIEPVPLWRWSPSEGEARPLLSDILQHYDESSTKKCLHDQEVSRHFFELTQCGVCSAVFKNLSHLKIHMLVHSPY
ncbi:uncharacterized protein LOC112576232 isoform X4 [Pomacea canaliculata]|uniref:uncharacterized protein LOC112576232 isoform X4 n=1 Tax=Pomacea canaliculata TaxID=400727 RepID=UPI000D72C11B|nr:uncharacterized protein LOC112576232 isoform X4 [Pomacea canaliculata]